MSDKTVRLHYAHSGHAPDRSDWQSLKDHLDQTAELAATFAMPLNLSRAARLTGALHDWGKHDPAFDNRLTGGPERVDHSTAGGRLLLDDRPRNQRVSPDRLAPGDGRIDGQMSARHCRVRLVAGRADGVFLSG